MIIEMGKKQVLTLPKDLTKKLKLKDGAVLDAKIEDGCIKLIPVSVYPKEYIEKLRADLIKMKKNSENTEQGSVVNLDELIAKLSTK